MNKVLIFRYLNDVLDNKLILLYIKIAPVRLLTITSKTGGFNVLQRIYELAVLLYPYEKSSQKSLHLIPALSHAGGAKTLFKRSC